MTSTAPALLLPNEGDRFLRLPEVCTLSGFRRSQVYLMVQRGDFPRPYKVGRASAWSLNEIQTWIEAQKAKRG